MVGGVDNSCGLSPKAVEIKSNRRRIGRGANAKVMHKLLAQLEQRCNKLNLPLPGK